MTSATPQTTASPATPGISTPTIKGPIAGGDKGWPFGASLLNLADYRYREDEFLMAGTATRYQHVPGTERSFDGHWQAEAAGTAPFQTRLLVYQPIDPADFNGTVIVTWNNVTAGFDLFGADSAEIFGNGFALVCVTTQRAGIHGLPPVNQGLATWDPVRYGALDIESDDYSFDVFTQAARAVAPDRRLDGIDPLGGLPVRHVVGQGASQSAGRLATYINAIQPLTGAFDGFILTIYFGRGPALEVGETVVNINDANYNSSPMERLKGEHQLRDDLGVPIFVVNSELEAMACHGVRQPDSDRFRYWESAGTCHVSAQSLRARQGLIERDGLVSRRARPNVNAIPMTPLYDAAFHHMHRWLNGGGAPPTQPRIAFAGSPAEIVRDQHGIAVGGVRLPQAEVPLAQNSAIPHNDDIFALLDGSSVPFGREKIVGLYGDRATFLERFKAAATAAVDRGAILPRDVDGLVAEAETTYRDAVASDQ